jgi:hypothetical protein
MSIQDMRAYLDGVAEGRAAAPGMVELFAGHAQRLEDELAALRVRHAYATAKVALWQARADGDNALEPRYAELLWEVATEMLTGSQTPTAGRRGRAG